MSRIDGKVIVVTGAAGSGKSRLLHELCAHVPADTSVWMARGDPMRQKSPFGMLVQILRRAADLHDNEPLDAQRAKLVTRVRRAQADPKGAQRIAEFLGEIVGVPFPDDASPKLRAARGDAFGHPFEAIDARCFAQLGRVALIPRRAGADARRPSMHR